MEHIDNATHLSPITQPRRSLASIARWFANLCDAIEQATSRRDLADLDDRMLADIGLSRGEAMQEASRSFFDHAPPPMDPSRERSIPGQAALAKGEAIRPARTTLVGLHSGLAHDSSALVAQCSEPHQREPRFQFRSARS